MPQSHHPLSRRTFVKTAGTSLLLPALPALAKEADLARPPKRLCVIFFGNGVSLPPFYHRDHDWHWFPRKTGSNYKLSKTLKSLEPLRDQFSIIGGLSHPILRSIYSHNTGGYFLTGADESLPGGNTVSMDQVHAQTEGVHTRFPSLTMATEGGVGHSRQSHTLSFMNSGQPIPAIASPRQIYNELFGIDSRDPKTQIRAFGRDRSILDAAVQELKTTYRSLGAEDKGRLDQYLTSVRSMEERLTRGEQWLNVEKTSLPEDRFDLDADPRTGVEAYLDSMYDLIHAAFLTDSTRSITFVKVREAAGGIANNFPTALGLPQHHTLSHSHKKKDGYLNWAKYDQFLAQRLSRFLTQLSSTKDPLADGTLLDNTLVLYGSGTSSSHKTHNYPLILAGGKNMGFQHGAYHDFRINYKDQRFSNLLLTILQQLGSEVDRFSDSDGTLSSLLKS